MIDITTPKAVQVIAKRSMTGTQYRRWRLRNEHSKSYTHIAEIEGCSVPVARRSVRAAEKKYEEILVWIKILRKIKPNLG